MNIDNNLYQQASIYNQYGRAQNYDRKPNSNSQGAAADDRDISNIKDKTTISRGGAETSKTEQDKGSNDKEKEQKIQQEVQKLRAIEEKVKAHEQAHKSAGGQFAGAVNYSYTTGPDGKRYITGGEVAIQIVQGKTPEETIRNMEIVRRAALAPADPSPQDRAVAAQAAQIQQRARSEQTKLKAQQEKDKPDPSENDKETTSISDTPSGMNKAHNPLAANAADKANESKASPEGLSRINNNPAHSAYKIGASLFTENSLSLFA